MLSEQLLLDRAGNFTASENHRLMAGWDNPQLKILPKEFEALHLYLKDIIRLNLSKPLVSQVKDFSEQKITGDILNKAWAYEKSLQPSTGLITYAEEKAMEQLFDIDPSLMFSNQHTRNGEEREADCMFLLAETTGLDFINVGDRQTHIHADEVGCTPDGIVLDDLDLVLTGAEVKCKSPLEHAKNLLINNNDDLKENAFDHYVQIQTAMLVTSADHWYFANYNPYARNEAMKFKYIIIRRDDDFIKILKSRIETAKQIKSEFLKKFDQFKREN